MGPFPPSVPILSQDQSQMNNLTAYPYIPYISLYNIYLVLGPLCKPLLVMELPNKRLLLFYCPKGKVVMTDKGFAISDLCHEKGVHHNRPPLTKVKRQYDENDVSLNFDIASLRIYNETAIGRIRAWSVLNK